MPPIRQLTQQGSFTVRLRARPWEPTSFTPHLLTPLLQPAIFPLDFSAGVTCSVTFYEPAFRMAPSGLLILTLSYAESELACVTDQ